MNIQGAGGLTTMDQREGAFARGADTGGDDNVNWLKKRGEPMPDRAPQSLEHLLDTLQRYGDVSLRLMRDGWKNDGWSCSIKMHVSATGASFNVSSGFGCKTASAAAAECLSRVEAAVANQGSKA